MFSTAAELVENRICQNMANIQLNGGLNKEQAKATSTSGAGTTAISITTSTMTTTLSTTHSAGGGGGAVGLCSGPGAIVQMAPLDDAEAESHVAVAAADEDRKEEGYSLLSYPKDKSCFAQFTWLIIWPIHLLFRIAIPDCKKAKNNKIFPLTFIMCIVWIGSLSYVVAWMITIIGKIHVHVLIIEKAEQLWVVKSCCLNTCGLLFCKHKTTLT